VSDFDLSGLDRLAADLTGAGNAIIPFAVRAAKGTAFNVKKDWNAALYRQGHAKWTGYDITYDVTVKGADVDAEIGAQLGKLQSGIVRLLEFGTPTPRRTAAARARCRRTKATSFTA
jgi:hypothetical protein